MKRFIAVFAALAALAAPAARADSFFQVEAALGGAHVVDVGDGTWQQWGAPFNSVRVQSPVAQIGLTGTVWQGSRFDLRYHVDYVYIGEYSAACRCAEHDEDYDTKTHTVKANAALGYYSGHGHLNGIAATLDAGYNYGGWRVGLEGGLWAYIQTWNQYAQTSWGAWHLQAPRSVHYTYVVGARVARGPLALSYRYYNVRQDWSNGVPGLANGVHAVTLNYTF